MSLVSSALGSVQIPFNIYATRAKHVKMLNNNKYACTKTLMSRDCASFGDWIEEALDCIKLQEIRLFLHIKKIKLPLVPDDAEVGWLPLIPFSPWWFPLNLFIYFLLSVLGGVFFSFFFCWSLSRSRTHRTGLGGRGSGEGYVSGKC